MSAGGGIWAADRRTERRLGKRFAIFALIVVLVGVALGARLFTLQIANGGYYAGLARDNRLVLQPILAARGLVFDSQGRQLVDNIPTFVVKARPSDLPDTQRPAVVNRLASLLEMSRPDVIAALDRGAGNRFEAVTIATDVPTDVARIIAEEHLTLPGVEIGVEARRSYRYGSLVSQLMGFTGAVSAEELAESADEGYLRDDVIGKQGLELSFENVLRGQYGVQEVERDARGQTVRVRRTLEDAQPGNSLELTIDLDIQRNAQTAMEWAMDVAGLERGVVIVMNPQTGEILAMVSLPTYDDNEFARGITNARYRDLLEAPGGPLKNYAIAENFPPGSTYKLVTATGGLADEEITDDTILQTRPYLTIGNYRYWDWNRQGFGPLDIREGFAQSSDTFFYQVAGMLGIDRLAYWGAQFGFGERTGIDLPGEVPGILPSNEWKERVFNEPIYPGEVYQAGIGQGYNSFTPIQVLNAYSAMINGGDLHRPQLVKRVLAPDGSVLKDFQPELIRNLPVKADVLRTMRQAARRVVTSYHTYNLVDLPLAVAGKTGTAEFGERDSKGRLPYHSWFVGFVAKEPFLQDDDPTGMQAIAGEDSELAVLAFAYNSNTTGNPAVETVKYFLQLHYGLRKDYRQNWLLERDNFYGQ